MDSSEDLHIEQSFRRRKPFMATNFQQFKRFENWVKDDAIYLVGKAVRMTKNLTYAGTPLFKREEIPVTGLSTNADGSQVLVIKGLTYGIAKVDVLVVPGALEYH